MDDFPIPIPERMPTRQIRDRYPDKRNLPLSQISEVIRRSNVDLVYKPLLQFVGKRFMIQLGPRVVSLVFGRDYSQANMTRVRG